MGMFDWFNCEKEIANYPFLDLSRLQTKDTECELTRYKLTSEGRLLKCVQIDGDSYENEIASDYTGWINAYTFVGITKDFIPHPMGITEGGMRLNFNFNFEFFRGTLYDFTDRSYAETFTTNPNTEERFPVWVVKERISIDEFLNRYNNALRIDEFLNRYNNALRIKGG